MPEFANQRSAGILPAWWGMRASRQILRGTMLRDIGSSKAGSGRGQSKERTIKSKPRPEFPVRKFADDRTMGVMKDDM